MAYTVKVEGIEEVSKMLNQMAEKAPGIAAQAVYTGAGTVADELNKQAKQIRTAPFKWASRRRGETRLPSPEEKAIIEQAGAGIAKFDKNGTEVQTSVGYQSSGYAELAGKTVPVPLIVNSINSGTSFMRKQPFVRKASNTGGKKAAAEMTKQIEDAFNRIANNQTEVDKA